MKLWVDPDYRRIFPVKEIVADMKMVKGEVFRVAEGRKTLRFEREGQFFFLKRHSGVGWAEIFKNLFQGRLPILSAVNEYQAIERLQILNISTLHPIAFCLEGSNPASQQSFLLTRELANTISLEDLVLEWQQNPDFIRIKRKLIHQLALVARRLHRNGLNHRDFYLCHLHVDRDWPDKPEGDPEIFVIDLHRAQIRGSVPQRWLVKDIASLYFSAMDAGLTQRDYLRFMKTYFDEDFHTVWKERADFLQAVKLRADKLYATRPEPAPGK